jgi:hypothetical protein
MGNLKEKPHSFFLFIESGVYFYLLCNYASLTPDIVLSKERHV